MDARLSPRLTFLFPLVSAVLLLGVVEAPAAETRCAVVEVFLRGESELSAAARAYVEKHYAKKAGVVVTYRDVAGDEAALARFYKLADHFKIEKPGLPAFYASGRFEFGWDAKTSPPKLEELLTVEVFVRQGCPRCALAHPIIFEELAPRYPGYKFVEKDIAVSGEAQRRLQEVANRYGVQGAGVPALHMGGRLMIGFIDAVASFRQWDDVLKGVTVPCPPKSSWNRPARRGFDERPLPWFAGWGGVAQAGDPPAFEPVPELPPPPPEVGASRSSAEPLPPEVGPLSESDAEAPPPRPRRELPPEVSETTDPPPQPPTVSDTVYLPMLGQVNWKQWGLPAFTILVGLVDGFNPCAMWVLLFLLSLLVNLRDRWKILAVAGTFVFISGAAYLAFMAAWLNVFQFIGLLRPAQILLGLLAIGVGTIHVKDFFAFKQGVSLSIPEAAKPKLYERMRKIVMAETLIGAIVGASVLAVLVNIVELLCTAGLPAMYTGILTLQNLPAWENFLYLLLYIAAYMFDDSLMVTVVVVTLGKHRLQETGGRVLKLISGAVILALGIVMIVKPEWLV